MRVLPDAVAEASVDTFFSMKRNQSEDRDGQDDQAAPDDQRAEGAVVLRLVRAGLRGDPTRIRGQLARLGQHVVLLRDHVRQVGERVEDVGERDARHEHADEPARARLGEPRDDRQEHRPAVVGPAAEHVGQRHDERGHGERDVAGHHLLPPGRDREAGGDSRVGPEVRRVRLADLEDRVPDDAGEQPTGEQRGARLPAEPALSPLGECDAAEGRHDEVEDVPRRRDDWQSTLRHTDRAPIGQPVEVRVEDRVHRVVERGLHPRHGRDADDHPQPDVHLVLLDADADVEDGEGAEDDPAGHLEDHNGPVHGALLVR